MRLEKREVMLNEKESLADMLFFEENLASAYLSAVEAVDVKEARVLLEQHAQALEEWIGRLHEGLEKTPKM
ncbi:MAG: hypothetical protein IJD33_04775 [Clostridia bacterium]|nr:hypothetical protein [Clostridia bacterium]